MVRHTFYAHHAERIFRTIGDELAPFGGSVLGMSLKDASLLAMAAARLVATLSKRAKNSPPIYSLRSSPRHDAVGPRTPLPRLGYRGSA